jgi:fibronectin type 3 domain-containing protein
MNRFFVLFLLLILLVPACGKKAPPRWVEPQTPPAPLNLSVVSRQGVNLLGWDFPAQAYDSLGTFILYRSSNGEPFKLIGKAANNTYSDQDIEQDTNYTYKITAREQVRGTEGPASSLLKVIQGAPKPAPADLKYIIGSQRVSLSWTAESGKLYALYRKLGRAPWELAMELDLPPYEDDPVTETTVSYLMRELKVTHGVRYEGVPSDVVKVAPSDYVPSAPTGVDVVQAGTKVLIFWSENPESWVRAYRVYRKEGKGSFRAIGESRTVALQDIDPPSGRLSYVVRALGPEAEGAPSIEKAVQYKRISRHGK